MQLNPTPPPPPQQAVVGEEDALVAALERQAVHFPELAFTAASRVRRADRRDRIFRLAFLTAASLQRDTAVRHLSRVIDRPWIAEVPFPDAVEVALIASAASPDEARRLLLASALRNPSMAVRAADHYRSSPSARKYSMKRR